MLNKLIPLPEAPRILLEEHGTEVSYRRLYNLVLDGKINAKKDRQSGRWMIPDDQMKAVCVHLSSKKDCD